MSETGSESPKKASDDEHLLASSVGDAPSIIAPFNEPAHVVEEKVPTTNEPKTDGDGDLKAKTTLSTTEINRSSNSNESDAEEKSQISKCSLNEVVQTEGTNLKVESTLVHVKDNLDESSTICNDLVNLTSDNQQQKEKDENNDDEEGEETAGDEDEQVELLLETPDEGSCSRSRPYTRQSKERTCERVVKMPTPPPLGADRGADEDEDLNDSKKIICHLTNPLESLKKDATLNNRAPVSEVPPTESSDQKSDIGVSENEKLSRLSSGSSGSDSSSESETSSKPVSNKVVATAKIGQQRSHSPPSSNNSISCGVGLVNFPGSNHDHKDKRLAVSPNPVTKNVPTSGQLHHNNNHHEQHQGTTTSTKKGSKIPVGIAVAWQRLVTSNSSLHNSSSSVSTMSCAPSHKVVEIHKHHKEKVQLHSTGGKIPVRPSSASPIHVNVHATSQHHAGRDASGHKIREVDVHTSKSGSYSISRRSAVDVGGPIGDASVRGAIVETSSKSVTPELTTTAASCRPLPSSSVPPNLGLSYFHQQSTPSLLDYHYGSMRSLTPFPPPPHPSTQPHNLFHSLPPTWQASTQHHHLGLGMDLNVPQGFPSAGAYIQQTMQNQLQFQQHLVQQYSNYGGGGGGGSSASSPLANHSHHYLPHSSVGYENTLRQHYEQLLQQQQQSEYFRHHFHQQQQSHLGHQLLLSSAGMYNTVNEGLRIHPTIFPPITTTRIPLLSPSSTGGVRTPTPTNSGFNPSQSSHSLSLCNLSAIGPAAGQPQTTTTTTTATVASPPLSANCWSAELFHHNSSTALSPKSLTSSSPSPVTVQQTYKEQGSLTINTIAGGGTGGCSENTVTTFVGRNKCATPTTSPNLNRKNTFPRRRESPLGAEALQDQQKQHLSTSSSDKDLVDGRQDETIEELDQHTDKEIHHGRLNKHSSAPKTSSSSSEYSPNRDFPSSHVQYDGKREGNKRDLDETQQHAHPTTKTEGQIAKHDFKRLDSLIEKRNSEAKSDEEGEVPERDHDDDENLMMIKSGHEMTSTSTSKSVMMGEGMHPDKVFTPVKADLKQNIVPLPLSLGNSSGTDLNQNLKMVVSPPQISTLPVSKVKAVTPTKKAKPKVKVSKGDDDGYDGTNKKSTSKTRKPAAPKEKVSLQPKENKIKEKPPRNNPRKSKSQVADLGESGPVVKARKPCKIKPDMNTTKSKDNDTTTSSSSESLQLKKQPKQPKVYKSKKAKDQDEGRTSRRLFSPSASYCDSLQNVRESNGNNVPETNLPVAVTSGKVVTDLSNPHSSNSDMHTFPKNDAMLGLSPGGITTAATLTGGSGRGVVVPQVASGTVEKKGSRSKNSTPMLKNVKDGSNKSPKRKNSDPKQPRRVKSEIKAVIKKEKANVVKRERRKPVAIKSKGTEVVTSSPCSSTTPSSAATTTVILTTPTHPTLSFPGGSGGPIGMNPAVMTFSNNNSASSISSGGGESCSVVQSSPIIPISLPYHNSPVTLILPRLLPQTTITNSHQQTSFKLVVSSQEIKIPAFVPTQPGGLATIEGTSQVQTFHLHHREQNYQNHIASSSFTSFHNQSMMRSAVTTSSTLSGASGPLFLTTNASSPCDTVSNSDNTITFIRDSPMSPPHQNHNGIFEGIVRNPNLLQQQQQQQHGLNPTLQSCYLSPPMTNQVRKEFIQPEDSHLNLLATVAQEFGSRDDLGKLASHSNSSRGSSLMTSPILPVQSPELNYFPTPSSTISSASTGSNNTAVTSISLPSSPLNAKFISKSPHRDEYEYDEKEDHGNSTASPGSYKHPVWLKIPTIVPTAAKTTTPKKRKPRSSSNATAGSTAASHDSSGRKKPSKKQKEKEEKFDSTGVNSVNKNVPRHPKPKVKSSAVTANSVKSESSAITAHKLKIPKIALEKPKLEKERQLSPTKKAKEDAKKIKQEPLSNEGNKNVGGAVSMKIKLPLPTVAKIRIKLSETENPTLMGGKTLTNGKSKPEIKQQRLSGTEVGGGDSKPVTLSRKRKQSTGPQVEKRRCKNPIIPPGPEFTSTSTDSAHFHKNDPLKLKRSKAKNYHHDLDNTAASPKEKGKRNSKNKPISVKSATLFDSPIKEENKSTFSSSLSPQDSLVASSSFASLTPPPTANNNAKPATGAVVTSLSASFSPKTSSFSLFSPPTFERQPQTSNRNNGGGGDTSAATFTSNKPISWVSDPTFAASAIRMYGTSDNPTVKSEKVLPFSALSSDEDEDQVLMEYERRTAERMRNEDKTIIPNRFNSARLGDAGEAQDGKAAFVPYTSPNKRPLKHQQHHIKPCLKAEPRPRSGSSEDENSDAEVDFEVASLTNSIPRAHTSMLQHHRNSNKLAETSSSVNKSVNNVTKNSTETISVQKRERSNRRRLSSTASSKKKKHVVGRRLSLNLETGRTHEEQESEEELLDIGGDYDNHQHLSTNPKHHRRHHHHHRRQSASSTKSKQSAASNENKPNRNANKYRRFSGGSTSTSASFGSTMPKKLPKKRGSRSLTTSSRSSVSSVVVGGGVGASTAMSRSRSGGRRESIAVVTDVHMEETLLPGKIELSTVAELKNEMRILTEIQGLFYTGKLNALQPPDVYGVTLDNERGAPPHLIFPAQEVLLKCVREKKPQTLSVGLRICAYWSPQYSGLYPGRVSTDFNPGFDPEKDLIPIEFDDGDTGMIKLAEIRLLPTQHPIREYDPNPLLTLEKKHRKRRQSSGVCTGDHEEPDCGESYCAKIAKMDDEAKAEEDDDDDDDDDTGSSHRPYKSLYWTWTGLGYKRSKAKKSRNKEFFKGIQRGDNEVINVGESAIFISHGNERPYIGRIEKFWEKKGQKIVNVRWFYHPEEVKSPKRIPHLKHTGALFESPHIDENDVQTIKKKCDVIPYSEFKERIGRLPKLSIKNSPKSLKPKDLYYVAGYYDPYNYNLQMKI